MFSIYRPNSSLINGSFERKTIAGGPTVFFINRKRLILSLVALVTSLAMFVALGSDVVLADEPITFEPEGEVLTVDLPTRPEFEPNDLHPTINRDKNKSTGRFERRQPAWENAHPLCSRRTELGTVR